MTRFKPHELARILARENYGIPTGIVPSELRHPVPKQDAKLPSLGADQDEEGSAGRFVVRIERRGARLLDADNLAGSVKFVLDALRYQKLIPEDNPAAIDLEVSQVVVKKKDRGTYIKMERIP